MTEQIDAAEYLTEQLARDRGREVWAFCDELALLSRFSDQIETRTAEGWRTVLDQVVASGKAEMIGLDVRFVAETAEERRQKLSQGVLFE